MGDAATVTGTVEGAPRSVCTDEGLVVVSLRLRAGSNDAGRVRPADGAAPGCYLVTILGESARGVIGRVQEGDAVIIGGTLTLRDTGETHGVVAELLAEIVGFVPDSSPRPATAVWGVVD